MRQLHVVLWLWNGWRPIYKPAHVNAIVRMLRLYLPDARVLCCTEGDVKPQELLCEAFPLWPDPPGFNAYSRPNCFRRLRLFDPDKQSELYIAPGDYIVSLDIDTVIEGNIAGMVYKEKAADFIAVEGAHSKYNGSMWRLTAGSHADVWADFNPNSSPQWLRQQRCKPNMKLIGSDQAWLSMKIDDAPMWGIADGLFTYSRHARNPERADALLWNFAGGLKPWDKAVKVATPLVAAQYERFYYE